METKLTDALNGCTLFAGLSGQEIAACLDGTQHKTVTYHRHDTYCMSGDPCRHVDIVVEGELLARMTGLSGRQVEVIRIRRGDMIAPCFVFATDRRMPVEIEAVTDTRLLRISPDALDTLAATCTAIRRNLVRTLSDIGAYLAEKIAFLSLMTVREKVVCFLRSEAVAQHSRSIRLDMSRQRIADSFGIQKFSLLRCLAELADEGIIKVDGRQIDIVDIGRLR